jgi:N-acetylmuramoyl-L-alanine amidase
VIDPGHGGPDPGAIGNTGLEEAQVVLAVCRKVEQYLKRMGYQVIMTRTSNAGLALVERAAMANRAGADSFLSVHANAAADRRAQGLEIWHPRPSDRRGQTSAALAHCLLRWLLVTTARRDRGLKFTEDPVREFTVLRTTRMPAVLVELAFLSNPAEAYLLAQEWFQEKAALGITAGMHAFHYIP